MLTNTLRKMIHAAYDEGESIKDIAYQLDISMATVREALDKLPRKGWGADKTMADYRSTAIGLIKEGYDVWVVYANFMDIISLEELRAAKSGAA